MRMNLETFVDETISQILKGIVSAQKKAEPIGASVNPSHVKMAGWVITSPDQRLSPVDFDVAVEVRDENTAGAGANISVFSVGIVGKKENQSSNSSLSRVKFKVFVCPPEQVTYKPR
jgi:hypothetical protein